MKQKKKKKDFQECYYTLGASLLGNMLIRKGMLRAGYGNEETKRHAKSRLWKQKKF